ncbi:hypothetical protein Tco_0610274 [Tanacetum coccineum]
MFRLKLKPCGLTNLVSTIVFGKLSAINGFVDSLPVAVCSRIANSIFLFRHGKLITIFVVVVKPTLSELSALWVSCSQICDALASHDIATYTAYSISSPYTIVRIRSLLNAASITAALIDVNAAQSNYKKTQRNLLKQQYENFTSLSLRSLIKPLMALKASVISWSLRMKSFHKKCYPKVIKNVWHLSGNTYAVVWRNKADLDTMNMDDLYNNLKGNPQMDLQDQGVIDSGCSRHMTWNISYLTNYEEIDGGYVAF